MERETSGNAAILPTRPVADGPPTGEVGPLIPPRNGINTPSDESLIRKQLTEGLPPPNTKRWVVRRKAAVVAAVRSGAITAEEACRRYQLSEEEFRAWERALEMHGLAGLRATRIQQYRLPYAARPRSRSMKRPGEPGLSRRA